MHDLYADFITSLFYLAYDGTGGKWANSLLTFLVSLLSVVSVVELWLLVRLAGDDAAASVNLSLADLLGSMFSDGDTSFGTSSSLKQKEKDHMAAPFIEKK